MTKLHVLDVIKHVIVDLDDTLYINEKVPEFVRKMIIDYIERLLQVPHQEATALCMKLYLECGTTLAGLCQHGYSIDFDHWHSHVHGHINYKEEVRPDPELRALLERIPLPKHVFTNADSRHAWVCLENLGMDEGLFDTIVHFESLMERATAKGLVTTQATERGPVTNVVCKPSVKAFQLALELCGIDDATSVLFCDDSARNIAGAKKLGMTTCIVGRTEKCEGADFAVKSLHDLPKVLPGLFGVSDDLLQQNSAEAAEALAGASPKRLSHVTSLGAGPSAKELNAQLSRRSVEIAAAAGGGAMDGGGQR